MKRSLLHIVFASAVILLPATSLFAQFETAEVLGTVHDPSHAAIADAAVTQTNQDTATEAKTKTDAAGDYDFFDVKIGRYTVTIEKAGFSKFSATEIHIDVGVRQRVDAELKIGAGYTDSPFPASIVSDNATHCRLRADVGHIVRSFRADL